MKRLSNQYTLPLLVALSAALAAGCDDGGSNTDGTAGMGNMPAGGNGGGGAEVPVLIISDFETPSTTDDVYDGHSEDATRGWVIDWFTYTDKADGMSPNGMITPPEGERFVAQEDATRAGSPHVANITGGNWKSWGAGMGFNFTNPVGPVNLTEFKGVSFWGKANVPQSYNVKVKIVDARNTPVDRGGTCVPGMPKAGARCDDVPLFKAALTNEWQRFDITWDKFKPEGWGGTGYTDVQLDSVLSIQFQVGTEAMFSISVDSVGLITGP